MSREIDREIAEDVMGLKDAKVLIPFFAVDAFHRTDEGLALVPNYSTDVAAAWEVMEKLSGADPEIIQYGEEDGSWTWRVDFEGTNVRPIVRDRSIAMAICLAALRWKKRTQ